MLESTVLVEFVALQRRLIESLLARHPEFSDDKWLIGAPSKAELHMDEGKWDVSKHGIGLTFRRREPKPHLVVDVHVEIDNPNRLDAWRLQQFVESTGGVLEFNDAEVKLRSAVDAGVLIERPDGGFQLKA